MIIGDIRFQPWGFHDGAVAGQSEKAAPGGEPPMEVLQLISYASGSEPSS